MSKSACQAWPHAGQRRSSSTSAWGSHSAIRRASSVMASTGRSPTPAGTPSRLASSTQRCTNRPRAAVSILTIQGQRRGPGCWAVETAAPARRRPFPAPLLPHLTPPPPEDLPPPRRIPGVPRTGAFGETVQLRAGDLFTQGEQASDPAPDGELGQLVPRQLRTRNGKEGQRPIQRTLILSYLPNLEEIMCGQGTHRQAGS